MLNKKNCELYKEKVINLIEIDKLRDEKINILNQYNYFNYIGSKCDRYLDQRLSNLYSQLDDLKNGNL